ncbi:hypothetical protein G5714_020815 [Onychostoma macrolepis]|uniref:Uncharacterized protein n=1 Tax=Onychostoma macrolepis TaxID=369639 RepID=A0A7J6BWR9_9TELE|nr:hypothetical protein G5714_020815 [Onychostoma macrolepis]
MNKNKLFFGEPIEIKGEPDPKPIFNCDTWIFSSLACGFVLLLILLIITILYCSHLRTSQCHHTWIIQPQTTPADHSEQLNTPL